MQRQLQQLGLTLVELVLAASVLLMMLAVSIAGFQNMAQFQRLHQTAADVEFQVAEASRRARAAEGDTAHGIHFEAGSVTHFLGTSYSAADPDNEVVVYPDATLTASLTSGATSIVFAPLTGLPNATGTVTVSSDVYTASASIEITSGGVIQ